MLNLKASSQKKIKDIIEKLRVFITWEGFVSFSVRFKLNIFDNIFNVSFLYFSRIMKTANIKYNAAGNFTPKANPKEAKESIKNKVSFFVFFSSLYAFHKNNKAKATKKYNIIST